MGLNDLVSEEAKKQGVKLVLRQIPREVMEEQAAAKGDVQFFELAYLEASVKGDRQPARVHGRRSKNFVIPNPELVPDDVREKITKWSDYVDYWAVDWDFSRRHLHAGLGDLPHAEGPVARRCDSDPHMYDEPGEYAVMVKVIDIFGNDTSKILRVEVELTWREESVLGYDRPAPGARGPRSLLAAQIEVRPEGARHRRARARRLSGGRPRCSSSTSSATPSTSGATRGTTAPPTRRDGSSAGGSRRPKRRAFRPVLGPARGGRDARLPRRGRRMPRRQGAHRARTRTFPIRTSPSRASSFRRRTDGVRQVVMAKADGSVDIDRSPARGPRAVRLKMATGTGKTLVMALVDRLVVLPRAPGVGLAALDELPDPRAERHRVRAAADGLRERLRLPRAAADSAEAGSFDLQVILRGESDRARRRREPLPDEHPAALRERRESGRRRTPSTALLGRKPSGDASAGPARCSSGSREPRLARGHERRGTPRPRRRARVEQDAPRPAPAPAAWARSLARLLGDAEVPDGRVLPLDRLRLPARAGGRGSDREVADHPAHGRPRRPRPT